MSHVCHHCFYTLDTPYAREAERCRDAFAQYGLDVKLLPYKSQANWMKNCLQRSILLDAITSFQSDLVPLGLIDADLRPVKRPDLLFQFNGDFAAHYLGPEMRANHRYCAGLLIFGGTKLGRALLREWAELCQTDPTPDEKVREQVYLAQVADKYQGMKGFQFLNLGDNYNCSWETAAHNKDAVLIHWACSRFHAKGVGGPAW